MLFYIYSFFFIFIIDILHVLKMLPYLCELQRKNPNFVSEFTFDPIFIDLFNESNAVSLWGERETAVRQLRVHGRPWRRLLGSNHSTLQAHYTLNSNPDPFGPSALKEEEKKHSRKCPLMEAVPESELLYNSSPVVWLTILLHKRAQRKEMYLLSGSQSINPTNGACNTQNAYV